MKDMYAITFGGLINSNPQITYERIRTGGRYVGTVCSSVNFVGWFKEARRGLNIPVFGIL